MAGQRPATAPFVAVATKEESDVRELMKTRKVLVDTTGNIQLSKVAPQAGKDVKKARPPAGRKRSSKPRVVRAASLPTRDGELNSEEERPFTLQDGLIKWRAYRKRQREGRGDGKHAMWPEEYEFAFVEALWIWWPCAARKKIPLGDDKYGINELVGHYVSMVTKGKRKRKQTSSHKQVLKGYFKQMPGWEALVIEDMMGPGNPREDAPIKERKAKELEAFLLPMSHDERHPPPPKKKKEKNEAGGEDADSDDADEYPNVWPARFAVRVEKTNTSLSDTTSGNVHTHTQMAAHKKFTRVSLDKLEDWEAYFPCFSSLYHNNQLDCEIISMDVKLNMPVETLSRASTLGADLDVFAEPIYANHLWQCLTKIYSDGNLVWNVTMPVQSEESGTTDGKVKLQLPFAVDLWSEMLEQLGVESAHKSKREANADISRHLSKMSVVQELCAWAPPSVGEELIRPIETKRVAIFLWRFAMTRKDTPGKTTWRSVSLPTPGRLMEIKEDESSFAPLPPPASSLALGPVHEPPMMRWTLPGMEHPTEIMENTALDVHTPLDEAYESQPMPELSGGEPHLTDDAFHHSYCLSFDAGHLSRETLEPTEPPTIATRLLTQPASIHLHGFGHVGGGPCVPSSTDETYGSQTYHAHAHPFDLRPIPMEPGQGFQPSMPMQMYEHSTSGMVGHHEEPDTEMRRRTVPSMLFPLEHQVQSGVVLPAPTRVR